MDSHRLQIEEQSHRLSTAEQQVQQSAAPDAARQYAASLMREIANPLEAVNNLIFVAMEDAASTENVLAYMEMAQQQLQLLNDLARRTGRFCQPGKPY